MMLGGRTGVVMGTGEDEGGGFMGLDDVEEGC
jgi:hypothetical protein